MIGEKVVSQLCKHKRTVNLLLWFMSSGMVFDHPGLCPLGVVETRQDHVRSKHHATEFILL
jgi:hypothetical protein